MSLQRPRIGDKRTDKLSEYGTNAFRRKWGNDPPVAVQKKGITRLCLTLSLPMRMSEWMNEWECLMPAAGRTMGKMMKILYFFSKAIVWHKASFFLLTRWVWHTNTYFRSCSVRQWESESVFAVFLSWWTSLSLIYFCGILCVCFVDKHTYIHTSVQLWGKVYTT